MTNNRVINAVKTRHNNYFTQYLEERGTTTFDPVDLALYVCNRLQIDNDWLIEKLAKTERAANEIKLKPCDVC